MQWGGHWRQRGRPHVLQVGLQHTACHSPHSQTANKHFCQPSYVVIANMIASRKGSKTPTSINSEERRTLGKSKVGRGRVVWIKRKNTEASYVFITSGNLWLNHFWDQTAAGKNQPVKDSQIEQTSCAEHHRQAPVRMSHRDTACECKRFIIETRVRELGFPLLVIHNLNTSPQAVENRHNMYPLI